MKKGQVEVSYNWIFVLVAGAALFGFLIFLVASERDATEQRIANQYTNNLYNLINLQYQDEPGSSEILQTYSETFEFFCDAGGHGFRIEGGSSERTFETQPIFTPPLLSGDIIAHNLEYKMPFHLSPLLLVTDSNTKYYFKGESDAITRLYSKMADEFNKELLSASDDFDPTHRTNIVIAHPSTSVDADNVVRVEQTDSETVSETYRAYDVTVGGESYELLGESLVLSAITTGNQNLFQCGLDKVRERANKTLQLRLERSKQVRDDIEPDDFEEDCKSVFTVNTPSLKGVIPLLEAYSENIDDIGQSNGILSNVTKIDERDEELGRFSCPRVY